MTTSYSQFQNDKDEPTPEYNKGVQLEAIPPNTSTRVEVQMREIEEYQDQIRPGWIILSIFNFICCCCSGIPAIIFIILGYEADKKKDKAEAQRHLLWVKAFTLICFIFSIIAAIIGISVGLMYTSVYIRTAIEYSKLYHV